MIEKENCWYKNASSLLNCEIGSHGVNTCHSLKKSWMHVNHIWHFCVGRFKPQIDIMLLVNTYVLMMRMAAGTGQGGRRCEGVKGLRQKVWTRTKILSPNIRYFVEILRFVAIYALFGNLWTKNCCFFVSKTLFLGQGVHYYMVYIVYYTD